MSSEPAYTLLIPFIALGAALLITLRLIYARHYASSHDPLRLLLNTAAWLFIVAGVTGFLASLAPFFSLPLIVITVLVMIMAVGRYRRTEQRTLLLGIAVAAEKGIPLPQAARAFGDERSDGLRDRAIVLAEQLEAGVPLAAALRKSRNRPPSNIEIAVNIGCREGELGATLREALENADDFESVAHGVIVRTIYLLALVAIVSLLLTGVMYFVVPVFIDLFEEFEIDLPTSTLLVISAADAVVQYWWLGMPLLMLMPLLVTCAALYYVGWLPTNVPVISRVGWRVDTAGVWRILAGAVRRGQPLADVIGAMADHHPKRYLRHRLAQTAALIGQGAHWCDSLRRARVGTSADAAVLAAAERVGNLSWALEELADSNVRRLTYRLRAVTNIVVPLLLLLCGGTVLFIIVALMQPFAALIEKLS